MSVRFSVCASSCLFAVTMRMWSCLIIMVTCVSVSLNSSEKTSESRGAADTRRTFSKEDIHCRTCTHTHTLSSNKEYFSMDVVTRSLSLMACACTHTYWCHFAQCLMCVVTVITTWYQMKSHFSATQHLNKIRPGHKHIVCMWVRIKHV